MLSFNTGFMEEIIRNGILNLLDSKHIVNLNKKTNILHKYP